MQPVRPREPVLVAEASPFHRALHSALSSISDLHDQEVAQLRAQVLRLQQRRISERSDGATQQSAKPLDAVIVPLAAEGSLPPPAVIVPLAAEECDQQLVKFYPPADAHPGIKGRPEPLKLNVDNGSNNTNGAVNGLDALQWDPTMFREESNEMQVEITSPTANKNGAMAVRLSYQSQEADGNGEDRIPYSSQESVARGEMILDRWTVLFSKLASGLHAHSRASKQLRAEAALEMLPLWWQGTTNSSMIHAMKEGRMMRRLSLQDEEGTKAGDFVREAKENFLSVLQPIIMKPTSAPFVVWSLMGLIFIFVDVVCVPLLVFDMGELTNPLTVLSLLTFIYWVVDVPRNFITGYDIIGCTEMRPMRIAIHYLKTWFAVDLVIICFDIVIFIVEAATTTTQEGGGLAQASNRSLRMIRLTRMGRLMRLIRLGKLKKLFNTLLDAINSELFRLLISIFLYVILILIINHYVACAFYAVAVFNEEQENTWIKTYLLESDDLGKRYFLALHWSLTQFTPATNNVVPQNLTERIFAVNVVVFALVVFSSFVSSITNMVNQVRRLNAERYTEEGRVREFIYARKISTQLSLRINHFVTQHYRNRKRRVAETDINALALLPESMRIQLHQEVYVPYLEKNPSFEFFLDIDRPVISRVCHRCMAEKGVAVRQDIFLLGTQCKTVYCVVGGVLHYRFDETDKDSVEEGDWISEMAFWIHWHHVGQLTAHTAVEIVEFDVTSFHTIIAAFQGPLFQCLKKLAIFVVAHAERMAEESNPVTDISLSRNEVRKLAERSFKLHQIHASAGRHSLHQVGSGAGESAFAGAGGSMSTSGSNMEMGA